MKITNVSSSAIYYLVDDNFDCLHSFGQKFHQIPWVFKLIWRNNTPAIMSGAGNDTNFISGCELQNYTYEIIYEGFNNEEEFRQMYPEFYY
jgi:hypothetical protein